STTRFGRRWLNPIMTTIENRYVASRVTMPAEGTAGAMRKLRKLLDANQVVIVTAGVEARRTLLAPLQRGRMRLAPGSFGLSLSSGAALLPVFTMREPSGIFRCLIGAPLSSDHPDAKADAIPEMAARYTEALAAHVQRYPGQWRHWYHVL